jgi:hypothetical protein
VKKNLVWAIFWGACVLLKYGGLEVSQIKLVTIQKYKTDLVLRKLLTLIEQIVGKIRKKNTLIFHTSLKYGTDLPTYLRVEVRTKKEGGAGGGGSAERRIPGGGGAERCAHGGGGRLRGARRGGRHGVRAKVLFGCCCRQLLLLSQILQQGLIDRTEDGGNPS